MRLDDDLASRIDRAIAWLRQMHNSGGGFHRWEKDGEKGPVSSEITGYAAHLFAWLSLVYQRDEYRRIAQMAARWIQREWNTRKVLRVEPDVPKLYFFDMGMAARGMFACGKAFNETNFLDVAFQMITYMRRFGPCMDAPGMVPIVRENILTDPPEDEVKKAKLRWSELPGPYQLKAAGVWKLAKAHPFYDDLDLAFDGTKLPPIPQQLPQKLTKKAIDDAIEAADLLHPFAYWVEALVMGEASQVRALPMSEHLKACIRSSEVLRSDVVAQSIRIQMILGAAPATIEVNRLWDFQHSSGGFHFKRVREEMSKDLSVHATIFAIQAMSLAQSERVAHWVQRGQKQTRPPGRRSVNGPFGYREASIV